MNHHAWIGNVRVALAVTAAAAASIFVLIAIEEIVHDVPALAGAIAIVRVGAVALLVGSMIWQSEARQAERVGSAEQRIGAQLADTEARTGEQLRILTREVARRNIGDREHDALFGAVMCRLAAFDNRVAVLADRVEQGVSQKYIAGYLKGMGERPDGDEGPPPLRSV